MKLKIPVAQLKTELEEALKDSQDKYNKALKLYSAKLDEYVLYVKKQLKEQKSLTKSAPYLQEWNRKELIDALAALKLHVGDYVLIDDGELTSFKNGIQRLQEASSTSIAYLGGLSY